MQIAEVHITWTCNVAVREHGAGFVVYCDDLWAVLSKDKASLALLSGLFCPLEEVEVVDIPPRGLDDIFTYCMT